MRRRISASHPRASKLADGGNVVVVVGAAVVVVGAAVVAGVRTVVVGDCVVAVAVDVVLRTQPFGHVLAKRCTCRLPRTTRTQETCRGAEMGWANTKAPVAARAEACAGTARDGLATTDAKASTATNTRRTKGRATMRLPLTPCVTIGVAACDTATPPGASRSGRCCGPPTVDPPQTWCDAQGTRVVNRAPHCPSRREWCARNARPANPL